LNDHQIRTNQRFWDRYKTGYPFRVERTKDPIVRPNHVEEMVSDHILYVPIGDVAYWGFKNAADQKKFMDKHGGKVTV